MKTSRWRCSACNKKNDADRTVCVYCSTPVTGGSAVAYGQWICPGGTRNERHVTRCLCCGVLAPKRMLEPEAGYDLSDVMGKESADAYCRQCGAGIRSDDQFCGKCGTAVSP